MKMVFVVFVQERDGKYHAFSDTIRTGENLVAHINRYKAKTCHLCESRMQAMTLAAQWNETYKANGTSLL